MTRRLTLASAVACLLVARPATGQERELLAEAGKFTIEDRGHLRRLHYDNILFGTQFNRQYLVRVDGPIPFGLGTQWEALALVGALGRWDATLEPLNYYHRTGPVGTLFTHLRRSGAAPLSIGVVGLNTGCLAAYARRGESVRFYESRTELKELVADTDHHFTFLRDARRRGAAVDVTYGPCRKSLAADADRRFDVLLVEMFETGFDPGDRLTVEAVRLYLERVTPGGLVVLHLSNKDYRLEPVVARIARELKLVGRVWHSDADSPPVASACSWLVLARTEEALGVLAASATDQVRAFGVRNEALVGLLRKYPDGHGALAAIRAEWLGPEAGGEPPTLTEVSVRHGPQAAALYWRAQRLRDAGEPDATLARLTEAECGKLFQPLAASEAPLRTDARRPSLPRVNERSD